MRTFTLLIFSLLARLSFSQVFLNGDFEHNSASGDMINMSNAECNQKVRDVHSFGTYGDVDIIRSSAYGGSGAKNGTWYLGLTGGGTDIVALTLSAPLVAGKNYSISYYDRKTSGYVVSPIQIGLSTSNNNFGTVLNTATDLAILNVWTKRTFTFTAPNNGQYITVQMQSGDIQTWVNVDNFVFNNTRDTIIKQIVENHKDTIIEEKIVEKKEIPLKKHHKKLFNSHRINGRKFIVQESLTVASNSVKLMVWDKNKADGDEVSLYLNGELIIEKFTVSKTKKEIVIELEPGKNIIVLHALNLGSIPPNTAALSINDGSKRAKLITLVSTLKKSGALEVFYDPLVYK